jgi:NAD dependent epimerase/dehydratase family enzyme
MKIFITGGTGFIGRNLARRLAEKGHTIHVLTRSKKGPEEPDSRITYIQGESIKPGPWQEFIKDCDIIINLAGATIFSKWNKKQKKLILESRVKTTQNVVLKGQRVLPRRLLQLGFVFQFPEIQGALADILRK